MGTDWDAADVDAVQTRVRALTDLPGVERTEAGAHTGFSVRGRRFCWLQVDHHGDGRLTLVVKAPAGEQEALVTASPGRYFVPGYLGSKGWVGVDLAPGADPDWDEVAGLLDQAWRLTAPTRLLAQRR